MSTTIYHNHHIIPRHVGGTDHPDNLVQLTVPEHAEAHRKLYEKYGRWQDKLAYRSLSGLIGKEEIFGGEKLTTNNRMELTATIKALEYYAAKEGKQPSLKQIQIFTDIGSTYNHVFIIARFILVYIFVLLTLI